MQNFIRSTLSVAVLLVSFTLSASEGTVAGNARDYCKRLFLRTYFGISTVVGQLTSSVGSDDDSINKPFDLWQGKPKTRTPVAYLIVHGLLDTPEEMKEVAELTQQFGNTHALLLDGHKELSTSHPYSKERWLADVGNGIENVRKRMGDKVVVVGFSLGSSIAMLHQIWLDDPDKPLADALLLLSPTLGASRTFREMVVTEEPRFVKFQNLTSLILDLDKNMATEETLKRAKVALAERQGFQIASVAVDRDPMVDDEKAALWGEVLSINDPLINRRISRPQGLGLQMKKAHDATRSNLQATRKFQFKTKGEKPREVSMAEALSEILTEVNRRILPQ